jgi:glycyl-tRNA synthetase
MLRQSAKKSQLTSHTQKKQHFHTKSTKSIKSIKTTKTTKTTSKTPLSITSTQTTHNTPLFTSQLSFSTTIAPQNDVENGQNDQNSLKKSKLFSEIALPLTKLPLNRAQLDQLSLRKMIYVQSFEIYGGSQGLFDYGPIGSSVLANIRNQWRKQFIKGERMLEFSGSTLTPEVVLKASGHLERFTDWMTSTVEPVEIGDGAEGGGKNKKNGNKNGKKDGQKKEIFESQHIRTDKLVEDYLDDKIEELLSKGNRINAEENQLLHAMTLDRPLVGGMTGIELDTLIKKYSITHNGCNLNPSHPFNLMFSTQFGPSGKSPYYFRPETAQGIFVSFSRLFSQNNNQLPFSVAQIGTAYRNEISPRNGILRTREFTQAEIEHFVDPDDKKHDKFDEISKVKATFLSAKQQLASANGDKIDLFDPKNGQKITSNFEQSDDIIMNESGIYMSFEEAVYGSNRSVDNESLGYFLAKTLKFLTSIGIHRNKIRFRQHLPTEMAHYATDCWDAEILTTYGWVECVGHADRSAHDLTVHADATKTDLRASKTLLEPEIVQSLKLSPDKGKFVQYLKKNGFDSEKMGKIMQFVGLNDEKSLKKVQKKMILAAKNEKKIQNDENDENFWQDYDFINQPVLITFPLYGVDESIELSISTDLLKLAISTEKIHVKQFTPHVIEPSFGLARIFYSVLEHSYSERDESGDGNSENNNNNNNNSEKNHQTADKSTQSEPRRVLTFPPQIAPYQVGIYTVVSNLPGAKGVLRKLELAGLDLDLAVQIDDSKASIGRKYSRWDECGVPFAISIDSQSVGDDCDENNENNENLVSKSSKKIPKQPTVTIRERDSCEQIRVHLDQAMGVVNGLVRGVLSWENACQTFEKVKHGNEIEKH